MKKPFNIENLPKENIFQVPEAYFEQLPKEISKALPGYTLYELDPKAPFQVPEKYFQQLPQNIQEKVFANLAQAPSFSRVSEPFQTPENYFSTLQTKILAKTTQASSPRLEARPKEELFQVPENYFEGLSRDIQEKVSLPKARSWPQYLASPPRLVLASFLLFCLLGGIFWKSINTSLWKPEEAQEIEKSEDSEEIKTFEENPLAQEPSQDSLAISPLEGALSDRNLDASLQQLAQVQSKAESQIVDLQEETLLSYLGEEYSEEELVEVILETEQAATADIYADELLFEEDDYGLDTLSNAEIDILSKFLKKRVK